MPFVLKLEDAVDRAEQLRQASGESLDGLRAELGDVPYLAEVLEAAVEVARDEHLAADPDVVKSLREDVDRCLKKVRRDLRKADGSFQRAQARKARAAMRPELPPQRGSGFKAAAEALAAEKKKLQAQRLAEAETKRKAAEKARLAENARKAAAEAALLQKEKERKARAEKARLAAEKKAAAEAAEAKRLTEEAKVNATRKAEEDQALAYEKVKQAEAAHAETAKRRSERKAAEKSDQAKRVERAEAEAIRTANARLEALKTAGEYKVP